MAMADKAGGILARLGTPADTDLSTDIATIDGNVDTINSNVDQALSTTESNIRGADSDTLETLSDQIDGIGGGRAQFKHNYVSASETTYQTLINITGSGILYKVIFKNSTGGQTTVKITIDGKTAELVTTSTHSDPHYAALNEDASNLFMSASKNSSRIDAEYSSGLKIEYKATSVKAIVCAIYGED
jgi:hypothetical protein